MCAICADDCFRATDINKTPTDRTSARSCQHVATLNSSAHKTFLFSSLQRKGRSRPNTTGTDHRLSNCTPKVWSPTTIFLHIGAHSNTFLRCLFDSKTTTIRFGVVIRQGNANSLSGAAWADKLLVGIGGLHIFVFRSPTDVLTTFLFTFFFIFAFPSLPWTPSSKWAAPSESLPYARRARAV